MIEPEHLGDVVSTGEHLAMRIDYEARLLAEIVKRHDARFAHQEESVRLALEAQRAITTARATLVSAVIAGLGLVVAVIVLVVRR